MSDILDYQGASRVMDLLDANIKLSNITDRYGRPIHPEAQEFLSYHKQAKRLLIKSAVRDINMRNWIRNKEQKQIAYNSLLANDHHHIP